MVSIRTIATFGLALGVAAAPAPEADGTPTAVPVVPVPPTSIAPTYPTALPILTCATVLCPRGYICKQTLGHRPICVPGPGHVIYPCGPVLCPFGMVCCNYSCGICTPPDGACTQQFCSPPIISLPAESPAPEVAVPAVDPVPA